MKRRLRLITCGSVDDGKSTLVGRLLYESKQIFEDQLHALRADSKRYGTQGEEIDLALLVDGLQAEREQGITIDVAYRFFATAERRFIIADTPGHEQYTRNMATAASTADLALILLDARKGVLTQTRRHTRIVAMLGVKQVLLAVNKMDLVGWSGETFENIVRDYRAFAAELGLTRVQALPVSALAGDNVTFKSRQSPWYSGATLLEHLEQAQPDHDPAQGAFRMPVQWVNRPNAEFRGYCGRIAQGRIAVGGSVSVAPSGVQARVKSILRAAADVRESEAGESVTLVLDREVDVSRGDVIAEAAQPVEASDQFEARMLWMSEKPLVAGRPYLLKFHSREVGGSITHIKYRVDVNSGAQLAAKSLALNEIGEVTVSIDRPVAFEPYQQNRRLGAFIVVDRLTNETAGAGMLAFALRRASNIHWQALSVSKDARAALKMQRPCCLWFTGLSGAGKSTIADLLEKRLHADGRHTYLLDGDNVRHGLNRDLGFTEADRVENIRRVAEVAKLMVDAGLLVIVSFISPFRAERAQARALFQPGEFYEVFVDTPLAECERRDPKGLYGKARRGELKNFTGIDSAYEKPEAPDVRLDTASASPTQAVEQILAKLDRPSGAT
ncbi:MAG: bifunctional enzyme CysN/CysC [Betaproteobacteria bacterium]|nr:bifunctional enzyme CysN/CysC [Betaproteobacteria bacterium]